VCADTEGFADGENDGPFKDEENSGAKDADFIWQLDMMEELDVFPHNLAASSPLVVGDLVYTVTSNGVDEDHITLPSPFAPSFIAVNKNTGELVWESNLPGANILHGQWSNPSYGVIHGTPQVIFPGGDGWLYSFEPKTGELLWKFDCNPKDSVVRQSKSTGNPAPLSATTRVSWSPLPARSSTLISPPSLPCGGKACCRALESNSVRISPQGMAMSMSRTTSSTRRSPPCGARCARSSRPSSIRPVSG